MKRHLLLALLVLCSARTALAANVTVNSTTDVSDGTTSSIAAPGADGVISLREAITAANNTAGSDTISFAISGAGVRLIVPTSPLPMITDPVVIDGYTQPGASANTLAVGTNAVLLIELNGSSTSSSGLRLGGLNGGSTIRGLVINRFVGDFTDAGIRVISGNNVIAGCFIGVDPTGTTKLANGNGVRFVTGANNLLGGMTPAARNVLSGNNPSTNSAGGSSNVSIAFDGAYPPSVPVPAGTMIRGNYIGTDAAGSTAISDASAFGATDGVLIAGGTGTIIGGADADDGTLDGNVSARNIISGNLVGISTRFGTYDGDLTVQGNFIGTNASGIAAVGNYMEGINFNPYSQDGSRFTKACW